MSETPALAPLVQAAYQAADRAITRRLRARGFEVTRAHSAVLANIDIEGGTRATVLAERAGVTKQAIGQVIDDLERRGFVTRTEDPDDRRARLIKLRASGRRVIASARDVIQAIEARVLEDVGPEDVAAAQRALASLAKHAGQE
jgi:DNA-binding MarR family transcriptional regulator